MGKWLPRRNGDDKSFNINGMCNIWVEMADCKTRYLRISVFWRAGTKSAFEVSHQTLLVGHICFPLWFMWCLNWFILLKYQLSLLKNINCVSGITVAELGFYGVGTPNLRDGGRGEVPTYDFVRFSQKCMKMKAFALPGREHPWQFYYVDPPLLYIVLIEGRIIGSSQNIRPWYKVSERVGKFFT